MYAFSLQCITCLQSLCAATGPAMSKGACAVASVHGPAVSLHHAFMCFHSSSSMRTSMWKSQPSHAGRDESGMARIMCVLRRSWAL